MRKTAIVFCVLGVSLALVANDPAGAQALPDPLAPMPRNYQQEAMDNSARSRAAAGRQMEYEDTSSKRERALQQQLDQQRQDIYRLQREAEQQRMRDASKDTRQKPYGRYY